jgi:acetyl-CoA carboxylase biotin carboxyl carrier protein
MDLNDIRKLVRLMEKAELSELELDDSKEGVRVHLKRRVGGGEDGGSVSPMVQWMAPPGGPAAAPAAPTATGGEEAGDATGEPPPGTEAFKSPMVGTFYRAASPDAEPFVQVGTRLEEESVLCIIEAMKVMNEIKAEMTCEVVEILVENGEPVEYGQPLFLVKKG